MQNADRENDSVKKNGNGRAMGFYRLHRWVGLAAALLFVILAVTGPMLMHNKDLRLSEKWVTNDLLLSFYDTEPAGHPRGVKTQAGWVLAVDGVFLLDEKLIGRDQGMLIGAAVDGDYLVVASDRGLSLLSLDGAPIEHLDLDALPGPMLRLGEEAGRVIIETPKGRFRSDDDYLSWTKTEGADIAWLRVDDDPPSEQRQWALDAYKRHLITLHRLVSDVHSGRIIGSFGPYVMDAAAVAMLLMVASGLINLRNGRRRR